MGLKVRQLTISGHCLALEITPDKFSDERGFFSETYNKAELQKIGVDLDFVQDNHSLSAEIGTLRGLHFQTPPFAQAKLVRVVRGAIFDVAVDIRAGSPTFGKHISLVISADAWNQILVPEGFAHGFCSLERDTEVVYKVNAPYSKEHDKGILWSDPALGIEWPLPDGCAIVSEKDKNLPQLNDVPQYFDYETYRLVPAFDGLDCL
jgi:dTDP-4-dehydrorhamnose 3,5-epimerase